MKPRVTTTLWEDEGSLCFQVEARGVCVARREDNHMINGTKLLNVAGLTGGRRGGILKSEKMRHVVKIGPLQTTRFYPSFTRTSSVPPSETRKWKAQTLRVEDWEPYKSRIMELHIEQDLPLREVKDAIQKEFGLEAEYVCSGIASERGGYS
jgi:hypothetical protein